MGKKKEERRRRKALERAARAASATPAGGGKREKRSGKPRAEREHGMSDREYEREYRELALELVHLQRHNIREDRRLVVVFEGRDAAGKDGTIRALTQHLSPRDTRVVALGKPTDRDRSSWYFQRWVAHLPAADELVLFNRSWYNRAGVERVMGFAKKREVERFLDAAPVFERLLVDSGIVLVKFWLDIGRAEQERRLEARRADPLKQWKLSPIDAVALEHWDDYTEARDAMLARTHAPRTPWTCVRANDKPSARLAVIRHLLGRMDYEGKRAALCVPDPAILRDYEPGLEDGGFLER